MAARQTVKYTHKHANTSTRKTQKDIKNGNQQSYQQTDETGCSGKAVKGRETSGWVMQVDTIDYWLRQSGLQRRHTKHDKSSWVKAFLCDSVYTFIATAGYYCHFVIFLPRYSVLSRGIYRNPVSVRIGVRLCLLQVGVLSKRLNESNWFLARELPLSYTTLFCKKIRVSPKIKLLPCSLGRFASKCELRKCRQIKLVALTAKFVDGRACGLHLRRSTSRYRTHVVYYMSVDCNPHIGLNMRPTVMFYWVNHTTTNLPISVRSDQL